MTSKLFQTETQNETKHICVGNVTQMWHDTECDSEYVVHVDEIFHQVQ